MLTPLSPNLVEYKTKATVIRPTKLWLLKCWSCGVARVHIGQHWAKYLKQSLLISRLGLRLLPTRLPYASRFVTFPPFLSSLLKQFYFLYFGHMLNPSLGSSLLAPFAVSKELHQYFWPKPAIVQRSFNEVIWNMWQSTTVVRLGYVII